MYYGIDVHAGDLLGHYYVFFAVCVLLAIAVPLKRWFRRYPSAKRDRRFDEER